MTLCGTFDGRINNTALRQKGTARHADEVTSACPTA